MFLIIIAIADEQGYLSGFFFFQKSDLVVCFLPVKNTRPSLSLALSTRKQSFDQLADLSLLCVYDFCVCVFLERVGASPVVQDPPCRIRVRGPG